MLILCRHCSRLPVCRPRGLCDHCYGDLAIRALFPPRTTNRPHRSTRGRRLARLPTAARPGTDEKVAVMQLRYHQRVALFHPRDAG